MNKDTIFYFSFEQDDDTITSKSFIIQGFNYDLIENADNDDWLDQVGNMEEYGVHDWGTSPNDEINAIGFFTYEIPENMIDEVMEKWQNYFINNGATVSTIVDVEIKLDIDDYQIYQLVKEKLNK